MELRNGEATVDKLRARFEVLAKGDGEGKPQSYYIIKAAQRREELQRKGDELDQAVSVDTIALLYCTILYYTILYYTIPKLSSPYFEFHFM